MNKCNDCGADLVRSPASVDSGAIGTGVLLTCPRGCAPVGIATGRIIDGELAEVTAARALYADALVTIANVRAEYEPRPKPGETPAPNPFEHVTDVVVLKDVAVRKIVALQVDLAVAVKREDAAEKRAQEAEAVIERAWAALGTTAADASDDPETAALEDSIRISLQYERDQRDQAGAALAAMRAEHGASRAALGSAHAALQAAEQWLAGDDEDWAKAHAIISVALADPTGEAWRELVDAATAFDGPVASEDWPAARLRLHNALIAARRST